MYNVPKCFRVSGPLDLDALRETLHTLAARHEPLRSRFHTAPDESPYQVLAPDARIGIEHTDLRGMPAGAVPGRAQDIVQEAVLRPFKLADEPPVRVVSVRLGERESILLFVQHHIVCDYASWCVFLAELTAAYTALVTGGQPSFPPLPWPYSDFARQQQALWLAAAQTNAKRAYWRAFFAGLAPTAPGAPMAERSPADSAPPAYGSLWQTIAPDTVNDCKQMADQQDCTLFTIVLSAIALFTHHRYRTGRVLLCLASANRQLPGAKQLAGCFFTNVVLALEIRHGQTVAEFVRYMWVRFLQARQHQDMPFELFADELALECTRKREPPYRVYISYRHSARDVEFGLPNTRCEPLPVATGRNTKEDIVFNFWERLAHGQLTLEVEWLWNQNVFDEAAARGMARLMDVLLRNLPGSSNADIQSLLDRLEAG